MSGLRSRPYLTLLLALLLLVVIYPILHENLGSRLLFHICLTAVFLAAFRIVFIGRRNRILVLGLGVLTLLGGWSDYAFVHFSESWRTNIFHLSAMLFLSLAVVTILRNVYEQSEVTSDGICGALCGYLLVGIVFGHLYCLLEAWVPGSFSVHEEFDERLRERIHGHFALSYFSFVTLSTLGYGDITPATGSARSMAVIESVLGQFYIAVLVGDLIGKKVSQAIAAKHSGNKTPSTPGIKNTNA